MREKGVALEKMCFGGARGDVRKCLGDTSDPWGKGCRGIGSLESGMM